MYFGEIVEPSTRALIIDDDELEQLPEYKEPVYEWQGNCHVPSNIDTLIFADSKRAVEICSKIAKRMQPFAKLKNEGLTIYELENDQFLAIFDGKTTDLVIGEIVEAVSAWIQKAKHIHNITSTLISTFQPFEKRASATFSRCLTTQDQVPFDFCKKLESPNLIQGFAANVFSYCINLNLNSTLWVIYTDTMPLDSVNSSEIVRLLKALGLRVDLDFKRSVLTNNLYM